MKLNNKLQLMFTKIRMTEEELNDFIQINNKVSLQRMKVIAIALLILSLYFFYADYRLFNAVKNTEFKLTLIYVHVFTFIVSLLFLIAYKWIISNKNKKSLFIQNLIISGLLLLSFIVGDISSINSQRLTENIDSYILVVIFVAVVFPVNPKYFTVIYSINHFIFLFLVSNRMNDYYKIISIQINSTVTVIVSLFVAFSLYRYKLNEYVRNKKLKENESHFKMIFEVNPFPLILTRFEDGKIIKANKKALDFYGITENDIGKLNSTVLYSKSSDRDIVINNLLNHKSIENFIIKHKRITGEMKWVMMNYSILEYDGDECILSGVTDITELKKMEDQLSRHASLDSLTGIYNRRKGFELLGDLLNRTKEENFNFTICFIDIDHLKKVNDLYGHGEGDFLITTICNVIIPFIKKDASFFRYGGDEFIMVFPKMTESEVHVILQEINQKLNQVNLAMQKPYKISISTGLYYFLANSGLTIENIVEFADQKMYEMKANRTDSNT